MLVLSVLVHLPWRWVLGLGVAMIVGHNTLDGVAFPEGDWRAALWSILHVSRPDSLGGGVEFFPLYPLIPWIGVMPAGYVFGMLMQRTTSWGSSPRDTGTRSRESTWRGSPSSPCSTRHAAGSPG